MWIKVNYFFRWLCQLKSQNIQLNLESHSLALEIVYLLRVMTFVVNASGIITIVSGIVAFTLSSSSLL